MSSYLLVFFWLVLSFCPIGSGFSQGTEGWQRFTYPGGTLSSEGKITNGKPDGYWKSYYPTGVLKSEGIWRFGALDSVWTFYFENGDLKEKINYLNGSKNGFQYSYDDSLLSGVTVLKSKEMYINGVRDGNSYYYKQGRIFEIVPYSAGRKHGLVKTFTADSLLIVLTRYNNDAVIERELINRADSTGTKTGLWKELYANDRVYREMTYRKGILDGLYKEFLPDGTLAISLLYKNGAIVEEAGQRSTVEVKEVRDPNGILVSSGPYKNGLAVGIHRFYANDGTIIDAIIYTDGGIKIGQGIVDVEGRKQGAWKEFFTDGKVKNQGNYKNGLRTGDWRFYYPDGKVLQTGSYERNRPEGSWISYYQNDTVWKEEEYFEGEREGAYRQYNQTGKLVVAGQYLADEPEGLWRYIIGDIVYEGNYVLGLRDGKWKLWYTNGNPCMEAIYVQGNPDGRQLLYYPDGVLREERYYSNGLRVKTWKKYYENGDLKLSLTYENDKEIRIFGERIELPYSDKKTIH